MASWGESGTGVWHLVRQTHAQPPSNPPSPNAPPLFDTVCGLSNLTALKLGDIVTDDEPQLAHYLNCCLKCLLRYVP